MSQKHSTSSRYLPAMPSHLYLRRHFFDRKIAFIHQLQSSSWQSCDLSVPFQPPGTKMHKVHCGYSHASTSHPCGALRYAPPPQDARQWPRSLLRGSGCQRHCHLTNWATRYNGDTGTMAKLSLLGETFPQFISQGLLIRG